MRRVIWAGIGFVVVTSAAVVLFGPDDSEAASPVVDATAGPVAEEVGSSDGSPRSEQPVEPPVPSESGPPAGELDPRPSDEAARVEAAVAGEPIAIEVVDEDGSPWAGAEVVVLDHPDYDRSAYRRAKREADDASAVEAVLRRFGRLLVTDDEGRAPYGWSGKRAEAHVLRPFPTPRALLSRHENGVLRIVCERPPLTVRVIDADGRPVVGIPVFVSEQSGRGWAEPDLPLQASGAFAVTDADGLCSPAAARVLRASAFDETRTYYIRLGALVSAGTERAVPIDHPPEAVVEFQLPPTGSVRVRPVTRSGEVLPEGEARAVLMTRPPRADGVDPPPSSSAVVENGEAVFPWVETGLLLYGRLLTRSDAGLVEIEERGPATAGQEVVIPVPVGYGRRVTLRVVDAGDQPLVDEPVDVSLSAGESRRQVRLETGGDGRLNLSLDGELGLPRSDDREASLSIRWSAAERAQSAALELPPLSMDETVDLGDVRLEAVDQSRPVEPLIAAGRVVDPTGSPAAGFEVELIAGIRFALRDGDEDVSWYSTGVVAATDADGSFELVGRVDAEQPHRLSALGEHAQTPEPVPIEIGQTGLVLRTVAMGMMSVNLLPVVDRAAAAVHVELAVVRSGEEADRRRATRLSPDFERWFVLEPGSYDLTLWCPGLADPVLEIPNVVVPPGAPSADPRTVDIDLRHLWRTFQLSVVDDGGRPIRAEYRLFGESVREHDWTDERGQVELATLAERDVHLSVGAPGFRPQWFNNHRGDLEVRLERGIPIRCWVRELSEQVNPRRLTVEVKLHWMGDIALRSSITTTAQLDERGAADLLVAGPGRYDVVLIAPAEAYDGDGGGSVEWVTSDEVRVPAGALSVDEDSAGLWFGIDAPAGLGGP